MAKIENRIEKLENQQSIPNDFDEFRKAMHAYLSPNAPPLVITEPSKITMKEFIASCKPLRPKILY